MEHELGATERQALEAMCQALAIDTLPVDPEGWFTVAQIAKEKGLHESTVRRLMHKRVTAGKAEVMDARVTINGQETRTRVYRATGRQ